MKEVWVGGFCVERTTPRAWWWWWCGTHASPQWLNLEARGACTNRLGSNIQVSSYIELGVPQETVVVVGADLKTERGGGRT